MDPAKLKVIELRAELSQRGLDTKGNKPVLVERLRKALEDESKNPPAEKVPIDVEDSSDIAQKEISEKVNESARTLPPRTPGRASRSSSVSLSTPSKMSTRNAPKTASSPISMKQLSPSKSQNIEKQGETLSAISENPSEKATDENQSLNASDGSEPPNEIDLSEPLENEADNFDSKEPSSELEEEKVMENDAKSEAEDLTTAEECTVESSEEKVSEKTALPSEKPAGESGNSISPIVKEEEGPTETSKENQEEDDNEKKSVDLTEDNDKMEYNDNDNGTHEEENKITAEEDDEQDDKEEVENPNVDIAENTDEVDMYEDIPKEDEEEEEMSCNTAENANEAANDELPQDEQMKSESETEMVVQEDNVEIHKKSEKDHEMADVKEGETKTDVVAPANKNTHDRKRKRSPSPVEERAKSPEVKREEEEPEIDYSNVVLSWYDSDLNLTIDKNTFLSATPLHNDSFCYAWAGARGSHGFVQGKVYYETKITEECSVNIQNEEQPHSLRVGWSVSHSSLQLGEEKLSYGFEATGKKMTNSEFSDYGSTFGKDDAVGCYLDMSSASDVTISYTLNGKNLGVAFTIAKEELADKALFPHILSKNCEYTCNFGQEDPWTEEILEDYVPIGTANQECRVPGPQRPEKKENCEVVLMCGLPAAGKTCWAIKHATENPEKMYNILGTHNLLEKMTVMGTSRKQQCPDKWDDFVNKCTVAVNKLQDIAISRRRNYILDQTNVYLSTQRRKMKNFSGYRRKAIVVVPSNEEYKSRIMKREAADGKYPSDVNIMEMKANFSIPVVGEYFDAVEWVELNEEEGKKVIDMYNKEGKEAGFGQQSTKRPRFDRADNTRDHRDTREARSNRDNRESRDNRDHRDRRPNYPDRNRNPPWRGGSNMGWRDRHRGGHMRHGGGYGPGWRGSRSGPIAPPPHRNDRRGGGNNDRRTGNDRNRQVSSRQGGTWGPMNSNYQGSQSSGWGQGGNWSSGGQSHWASQGGGWGQQSQQWGSSWKGYGQGSYGQSSSYSQGYGNGNWNNNWNQQYYNQYWGQQQQSGQTTTPTTAAGGQAVSTRTSTAASSDNSETTYDYSQEWQDYNTQSYNYPSATGQQSQQRK